MDLEHLNLERNEYVNLFYLTFFWLSIWWYMLIDCECLLQVRWADIEERANQERAREIGFVIGGTNWNQMTDDDYADRALNRTKYI